MPLLNLNNINDLSTLREASGPQLPTDFYATVSRKSVAVGSSLPETVRVIITLSRTDLNMEENDHKA